MTARKPPWRDPALDGKPPAPAHAFPHAWWGDSDVACKNCHRRLSEIERRGLECVTNEHRAQAEKAGQAMARSRARRW